MNLDLVEPMGHGPPAPPPTLGALHTKTVAQVGVLQLSLAMPTYVLKCEICGGHKPFLVHEGELPLSEGKNPIQKHCPICRMMTNWTLAFPERRACYDRRAGQDRRVTA